MLSGLLGILLAGGVYVPLDPSSPRERHVQVLADADAACILADEANMAAAADLDLPVLTVEDAGPAEDDTAPPAVHPDDPAYILYTSGSTGQPKGVMQNHRNVLHHCRTYTNALHLHRRDRIALLASYAFDAAIMDIFGALLNGATLYPVDIKGESPEALVEWLAVEAVTVLHTTPTVYRYLLGNNPGRRLPAVRMMVLGGEEAVRRDVELYRGHFSSKCVLVNGLGPTESTLALQYFLDQRTVVARNTVPVGYPVAGTDVLLLDARGEPITGCGTGEVALRGRHVARGYWRRPELTSQAFTVDAADPSIVTYRTGDLAHRLPDGRIEFLGRRDRQGKIRGVRIELAEVESRLLEHERVIGAVVDVFEPEPGDRRLVAYVVATSAPMPRVELAAFLRQRLPEAMVPSEYVMLEALPLAPNGKVDRSALPAPDPDRRFEPVRPFVAPSTPTERALADIWATLLRAPEVSATDNFFALGGHSLLATQLASRVRGLLQVDLPLRQYFSAASLSALAALVDRSLQVNAVPATPAIPRVARELYRVRISHGGDFVLPASLTSGRLGLASEPGSESDARGIDAAEPVHEEMFAASTRDDRTASLADA